eukprot:6654822-Prymnesium_polylepis.2
MTDVLEPKLLFTGSEEQAILQIRVSAVAAPCARAAVRSHERIICAFLRLIVHELHLAPLVEPSVLVAIVKLVLALLQRCARAPGWLRRLGRRGRPERRSGLVRCVPLLLKHVDAVVHAGRGGFL